VSSINRITLVGAIADDPDARVTNSGDPMLRFTVATQRPSVEGMPAAIDYIPVIAWRQLAEKKDAFKKGDLILVDGRIVTRSYEDSEGRRKYSTEVEAKDMRSLGEMSGLSPVAPMPVKESAPRKASVLEKAPVDTVSLDDFDFGEPKPLSGYASGPKFDAQLDEDIPF